MNETLLSLSLLTPLFGMVAYLVRLKVYKYSDPEIIVFGVILAVIPVLNLFLSIVIITSLFSDIQKLVSQYHLTPEERKEEFFRECRTEWEY